MAMVGLPTNEQTSVFDKFTLANQADEEAEISAVSLWNDLYKAIKDSKSDGDILLFTDLLYSLTFAFGIIIINKKLNNQIAAAEYELTFMNDYSIEVKGIPRKGFTDEELISYLESFGGKVIELSYARYFGALLKDYK